MSIQSRWYSEPVRILLFSSSAFHRNKVNDPVFSPTQQGLLYKYMRIRTPPWILLCDIGPIPGLTDQNALIPRADEYLSPSATRDPEIFPTLIEANQSEGKNSKSPKDPTPHLSYIRNLQRKQLPRTTLETFAAGFQDYLQAPLQPLSDNLESSIYEVFEKDPVKYDQYEKAIAQALGDWVKQGKSTSGSDGRVVMAVVGAGRGPLVTKALKASEATGVKIELWAVEKNPNAFVVLQQHNERDWHGQVNLVKADMRSWNGPLRESDQYQARPSRHTKHESIQQDCHKPSGKPSLFSSSASNALKYHHIDILISELLGSFADNELSPECLDGVVPLLNPVDGISVPASYTAFVTPINAPRLHGDISGRSVHDPSATNTPSVVMLQTIDFLSTSSPPFASEPSSAPIPNILPAWTFNHGPSSHMPFSSLNKHNKRLARLSFRTRDRGVCHGLAGYFEAILYPGIELSTNPVTMEAKSADMTSWFPIYFPLKVSCT